MTAPRPRRRLGGALAVGLGIFLSRIAGLVRERVLAHYLGRSDEAGAFRAALRIPNFLQNLLGEGVLSAAFIPVYTRLRAEGRDAEAQAMARVVGTLLAVVAAAVTVLGVVAAGPLTELIAPGFTGATRDLTVRLVQITFPGVALLVLSAWCLGVQNSHRKFFLSYVSPVVWNAVVIGFAIASGGGSWASPATSPSGSRGAPWPGPRPSSRCSSRRCGDSSAACARRWRWARRGSAPACARLGRW
jgi:putative peptidoglycan lipid II flippase